MKILFASSEVWPLIKTGGLGDIAYSLPHALKKLGEDVRIVLPAYQDVLKQISSFEILGWLSLSIAGETRSVRVLQATHEQFTMPIWLIDVQELFDRPGNPYAHPEGYDWADNAERYTLFSLAVARLAMDDLKIGWKADVVHANDWQTGMVSAFLDNEVERPRRVFTIHNMAYGGNFSHEVFNQLHLPSNWWAPEGVEFYGNFSMLKAGMIYSDMITTVSPTYAKEICTPAFGYGMEGVLSSRSYKLKGILNGIDTDVWNPQTDPFIAEPFSAKQIQPGKFKNKLALFESFGANIDVKTNKDKEMLKSPLLGMVSRLVEQKGLDMVLETIPVLLKITNANFVFIGTGHPHFEAQLLKLSEQHPERVMVFIGYSEEKAHLLEAGSDLFLMPSRFEPCGLNQLYSLRYGTIPIVHRTGGLADTVVDVRIKNDKLDKSSTGFVFDEAKASELLKTILRALKVYANKEQWKQLQTNAMQQDFGWNKSAQEYLALYNNDATENAIEATTEVEVEAGINK